MLFSSHHVKGIYYQHDLLLWCWTFSPGWGSVCQVSPLQSSFLSPFHAYTLELKSHYAHPILRTGELVTLLPHFLLNLLPWIFFYRAWSWLIFSSSLWVSKYRPTQMSCVSDVYFLPLSPTHPLQWHLYSFLWEAHKCNLSPGLAPELQTWIPLQY